MYAKFESASRHYTRKYMDTRFGYVRNGMGFYERISRGSTYRHSLEKSHKESFQIT